MADYGAVSRLTSSVVPTLGTMSTNYGAVAPLLGSNVMSLQGWRDPLTFAAASPISSSIVTPVQRTLSIDIVYSDFIGMNDAEPSTVKGFVNINDSINIVDTVLNTNKTTNQIQDNTAVSDSVVANVRINISIVDSAGMTDTVAFQNTPRLSGRVQLVTPTICSPLSGQAGDQVFMSMDHVVDASRNDSFNGVSLSTLWSYASVSGGTKTMSNGLRLYTPPVSGAASTITSTTAFYGADVSINFALDAHTDTILPTSTVDYCIFRLTDNTGNYVQISRRFNTILGYHTFEWAGVVSGQPIQGGTRAANYTVGSLRLVVSGNVAYGYAIDNSGTWILIGSCYNWMNGFSGNISISTASNTGTEAVACTISNFTSNLGVLFGTVPSLRVDDTPPSLSCIVPVNANGNIGQVSIILFNHNGIISNDANFTYSTVDVMSLPSDGPGTISVSNQTE
jgi:hypothetical protein